MDWMKQLNEVMDYIDINLQSEISYDRISEIACCSIYNFQRMFSYIAQTSLSEYIRNRRLTLAAFDIIKGNERIIDVALKYGYDSQDAFSRAFRNFHGVLPSTVRNEPVMLKSCPKQFFPDYRPSGFLGIATGGGWGSTDEMDYILAVTNHVDIPDCYHAPVPEGMTVFSYPAATWVIINADGEIPKAVQDVYQKFYSEWLPRSGYKLSDLPVFECYLQEDHQEVWIAVEEA